MKRWGLRSFAVLLAAMLLSGCAGTPSQTEDDPIPQEIALLTDTDPIPVRELPLYEDVPLEEDEIITILDIGERGILLTVSLDDLEQGWYRTGSLLLYDPEQRLVTELESFADEEIMIASGCFVDGDYAYALLECDLRPVEEGTADMVGEGVIRRRGEHPWEIHFCSDCPNDLEGLPMLLALSDGSVAFALCGGQPDDPEEGGGNYRVAVVSPQGEKRVVFAPEDAEPASYHTMLVPCEDGYLFRVSTQEGHCFYKGSGDGAALLSKVECRAIYPWWVPVEGGVLFTAGYRDEEGKNYEKNALLTEDKTVVPLEGLRLTRFALGGSGRIAATDLHWQPYLLYADDGGLEAVRIDLPAHPTDLYCGDDGRLYAYQDSPRAGPVGLYEILEQGAV